MTFGQNLEVAFSQEVSKLSSQGEVVLFRCLMDALGSLSPKFAIEEFYGSSK